MARGDSKKASQIIHDNLPALLHDYDIEVMRNIVYVLARHPSSLEPVFVANLVKVLEAYQQKDHTGHRRTRAEVNAKGQDLVNAIALLQDNFNYDTELAAELIATAQQISRQDSTNLSALVERLAAEKDEAEKNHVIEELRKKRALIGAATEKSR